MNEEFTMEPKLKEALDKIGNTPMSEPEIYALVDGKDARPSQVFKIAAKGIGINDFDGRQIAEFVRAAVDKVTGYYNEDGTFKITEATKDCDQPNFEQGEDIYYLIVEKNKAGSKKASDDLEKKLDEKIWEASGLNKKDMTEWEQMLVRLQVQSAAINNTKTALGIQVKN